MQSKTKSVWIIDRSGSMESIASDIRGNFNQFIEKQSKVEDDNMTVTVVLFDSVNNFDIIFDNVNINDPNLKLTETNYFPRAMTPLNDAICKTIYHVEEQIKIAAKEDKPNKVVFTIMTDGLENDSKEFNGKQSAELIEEKKKKNWEFSYVGTDHDVIAESGKRGITRQSTLNYTKNAKGITEAFGTLNSSYTLYRSAKVGAAGSRGPEGEDGVLGSVSAFCLTKD